METNATYCPVILPEFKFSKVKSKLKRFGLSFHYFSGELEDPIMELPETSGKVSNKTMSLGCPSGMGMGPSVGDRGSLEAKFSFCWPGSSSATKKCVMDLNCNSVAYRSF